MRETFFLALTGKVPSAMVIGAGVRWFTPWGNEAGFLRRFVISRVRRG